MLDVNPTLACVLVLYYQPLSNTLEVCVKHFLSLADLAPEQLSGLLDLAIHLKDQWKAGGNLPLLQNKTLGMVFTKPSLRTRISFDMAMLHLGGQALYLSPNEISLGQRESVADVARVLSRYVDIIMARVFGHRDVLEWRNIPECPSSMVSVITPIRVRGWPTCSRFERSSARWPALSWLTSAMVTTWPTR